MQCLRVSCVERMDFGNCYIAQHLILFTKNLKLTRIQGLTLNSSILIVYPPSRPRRMGFPLGKLPTQVGLHGGWWSTDSEKKQIIHMVDSNKKNLSESDSENMAAEFPRFIVFLEDICLADWSPFSIKNWYHSEWVLDCKKDQKWQSVSGSWQSKTSRKYPQIKNFNIYECKAIAHEKLNSSKGVIRSRELSMATSEDVRDYKKWK